MLKEEDPKFVFLAGTPRSGSTVILASLDGHPDILVWPTEFAYFHFFQKVAQGKEKASIKELNDCLQLEFQNELHKWFDISGSFFETSSNGEGDILRQGSDTGHFNYHLFLERIYLEKERLVDSLGYLEYIFRHLKDASSLYKDKSVKYYLMLTVQARGFDWTNRKLIECSYILFPYRDMSESYSSLRQKYFKNKNYNLQTFFSIKSKKSSLYWLETLRRISRYAEEQIGNDKFFILPLDKLQLNPKSSLIELCKFLGVKTHPNIYDLTLFGIPFKGNANEEALNDRKIANRPSTNEIVLSSFEKRMFASLGLFDFAKRKSRDVRVFPVVDMLKIASVSAFNELGSNEIQKNSGSLTINILIARVHIFLNLLIIYFAMKNEWLARFLIERFNHHIDHMPLWSRDPPPPTGPV